MKLNLPELYGNVIMLYTLNISGAWLYIAFKTYKSAAKPAMFFGNNIEPIYRM